MKHKAMVNVARRGEWFMANPLIVFVRTAAQRNQQVRLR
jgi:hypothetical protein